MFCPKCGTDCKNANFCPECGTDLREQKGTGSPDAPTGIVIPFGKYEGTLGYVELRDNDLLLHKKVFFKTLETIIPYGDIAAAAYKKAEGLGSGYLAVRSRQDRFLPLADAFNAASDKTALTFGSMGNAPMLQVYRCLQAFAEQNCIDCGQAPEEATPCSATADAAPSSATAGAAPSSAAADAVSVDMDAYFQRFNPYKTAAIKALVQEQGMDLRQAKELVDREFARRQQALYAAQPELAARDFKRAIAPKKAARDERKAELDRQGVAYCPKCLSTSITANKKGFGIGKAVIGASLTGGLGLMAGNIGAQKVRLTCMKCGYQWMAGRK